MKNSIKLSFLLSVIASSTLPVVASPAGILSGSLAAGGATVNLSTAGTEDWALWGYAGGGTSTNLAPNVSKSGGSGISDLTYINPKAQLLRGLGQFNINFGFTWNNGDTTTSASGAHAGLQSFTSGLGNGIGEGFSFTVPASPVEQQLTVYVDEHEGTGQFIASLSDSSATAYQNSSVPIGGNSPGVYTIDFASGLAGQTLNVSWIETADASVIGDNPAIYAVTLSTVPEPSTWLLLGLGAGALIVVGSRRQKMVFER